MPKFDCSPLVLLTTKGLTTCLHHEGAPLPWNRIFAVPPLPAWPRAGHPEQQGYSAALAALAHLRFLPLEAREWWHYAGWRATRKSPNNTILCRSAVEKHAEKKDPCFLVH